jgi:hypothetical protein
MAIRILFTPSLYAFLKQQGYKYTSFGGLRAKPEIEKIGGNEDDYILVP